MASKQPRKSTAISPKKTDDFTLLRGIGPALAGRLHEADIRTFAQLASLSPAKLAVRVSGLSAKRSARQDWIGQARKLVQKKPRRKSHKKETATPPLRQHYENFTIEFLLDEEKEPRRTRVMHVQSGDADTWAGWESGQLLDFLARHAGVSIPKVDLAPQGTEVTRGQTTTRVRAESSAPMTSPSEPIPVPGAETGLAPPETQQAELVRSPTADLGGTLQLRDLEVISIDSAIPLFSLRQGQPYLSHLTLDLSEVVAPDRVSLIYEATVIFKQLGGRRYFVSEAGSRLKISDRETLSFAGTSLPPGVYRLEASVNLTSNETSPGLAAFLKGDLLQVY